MSGSGITVGAGISVGRGIGLGAGIQVSFTTPQIMGRFSIEDSDATTSTIDVVVQPYTVAVLISGSETNSSGAASIVQVTSNSFTWTKRTSYTDPADPRGQTSEIWYTVNNTGSTITETVAVEYDQAIDDNTLSVTTWTGCNLTTPWTSQAPYTSNYFDPVTGLAEATIIIPESNTVSIIAAGSSSSTPAGMAPLVDGWQAVDQIYNSGATNWEYTNSSYQAFASPVTTTIVELQAQGAGPIGLDGNFSGLSVIADALVGVPSSDNGGGWGVIRYLDMPPPVVAGSQTEDATATINNPIGFTINDSGATGVAAGGLSLNNIAFFGDPQNNWLTPTTTVTIYFGSGSSVASCDVSLTINDQVGDPGTITFFTDPANVSYPLTLNYPFTFVHSQDANNYC